MERFRVLDTCSSGTTCFSFEENGIKVYVILGVVLGASNENRMGAWLYLYGVSATRLRTCFQL